MFTFTEEELALAPNLHNSLVPPHMRSTQQQQQQQQSTINSTQEGSNNSNSNDKDGSITSGSQDHIQSSTSLLVSAEEAT